MVHSKIVVASSPARPEKLVVSPFMVLLRRRSCGRSRGRSSARSSPMFVVSSRNGSSPVEIAEGKDPGSPSVTCIGQVRIKKKKKIKLDSSSCRCFSRTALFWSPFSLSVETKIARPPQLWSWSRWLSSSCGWSHQKQSSEEEEEEETGGGDLGIRSSSDRFGGKFEEQEREEENVVVLEEEEKEDFVPTTPPKNALLLMRCRSAPHRTSSLPATVADQTETDSIGDIPVAVKGGDKIDSNQVSGRSCEESSRIEDNEKETSTPSSPQFIVTRSKSAPARKTAKLAMAETNSSHLQDIDNSSINNKFGKGKTKDSSSSTTLLFLLLSDDSWRGI